MSNSYWMQIAEAHRDRLVELNLAGVPAVPDAPDQPDPDLMNISIQKVAEVPAALRNKRMLIIFPQLEGIGQVAGNGEDMVGYGVGTILAWPSNKSFTDNLDEFLLWREKVRNKLLPLDEDILGLSGLITTANWEPGAAYDPANFAAQYDVQAFTMRYWVTEPRQTRS